MKGVSGPLDRSSLEPQQRIPPQPNHIPRWLPQGCCVCVRERHCEREYAPSRDKLGVARIKSIWEYLPTSVSGAASIWSVAVEARREEMVRSGLISW